MAKQPLVQKIVATLKDLTLGICVRLPLLEKVAIRVDV